ncbi:discoidin domain-containing protein [Candidatus Magnetaquicoccus inordinatus]|uniref:discoidin domain-containing protein n=1 Tax=Candidatus Magnetaquicoccus inordinatus TaxID=2496818 RepID=UPI00102D1450|nr:discoidin domain-containing protein [Candidatus Magnetaquicoccus inordinatus]
MAAYRYWRLLVNATTSGSDHLLSLYEVELRATPGGSDQCQGGVATAAHNDSTVYRLFDDNASSYWSNGGPGSSSWIQYDFGSGIVASVGEIRILPRSQWMSPQDFILYGSDDGSSWQAIAEWNGIHDWIGGVEKLFVPPPPPAVVVQAQWQLPYAVAVAQAVRSRHDLGVWLLRQLVHHYAVVVIRSMAQLWQESLLRQQSSQQEWASWLERGCGQPCMLLLEKALLAGWSRFVGGSCGHPLFCTLQRASLHSFSIKHLLLRACRQEMSVTWRRGGAQQQRYSIQQREELTCCRVWLWQWANQQAVLLQSMPRLDISFPADAERKQPLSVHAASVRYRAEQGMWTAELHLAKAEDFLALQLDEPFILHLGEESFNFLVDGKRLQRSHQQGEERVLLGISPLARFQTPRAGGLQQSWLQPISARQVVQELLPLPLEWRLPDWPLAPGLLSAQEETPLQVARRLVESAGGVIQSNADGSLLVRPLFAEAVADWQRLPPAHCVTDSDDIVALSMLQQIRAQVDQVTVRNLSRSGATAHDPLLTLALDQRLQAESPGQDGFLPGDTAQLLLNPATALSIAQLHSSTGLVLQESAAILWQEQEDIVFLASNVARLQQVAHSLEAFQWLGTDLGRPLLQGDGRTIWVPESGTAVLRLSVTRQARSFPLPIPSQLAGEEPCPIIVTASSDSRSVGSLEVTVQRETNRYPALELFVPLLTNESVLYSRARSELDLGRGLRQVELTILFRQALAAGQLLAIEDGGFGRTLRGQIAEVSHELSTKGWLSKLKVWC